MTPNKAKVSKPVAVKKAVKTAVKSVAKPTPKSSHKVLNPKVVRSATIKVHKVKAKKSKDTAIKRSALFGGSIKKETIKLAVMVLKKKDASAEKKEAVKTDSAQARALKKS